MNESTDPEESQCCAETWSLEPLQRTAKQKTDPYDRTVGQIGEMVVPAIVNEVESQKLHFWRYRTYHRSGKHQLAEFGVAARTIR